MWKKPTNRNFIERLFRALFFQKSPSISLNSLFHNSVCLCSCVHLMASVELLEYLSVWLWLAGILVASGFDESQPVSRGEFNLCLPTSSLVSLVPLDLASVGKVTSLPSPLSKMSWTEACFKGPCQQSVEKCWLNWLVRDSATDSGRGRSKVW